MADVTNLEDVKAVFGEIEEANEDAFYDIPYADKGLFAEDGQEGVPVGWNIYVHDVQTDLSYDSYGNGYTEDAAVIFRVTDDVNEQLYLLPVSYASFEGWSIRTDRLVKTAKTERVVSEWSRA